MSPRIIPTLLRSMQVLFVRQRKNSALSAGNANVTAIMKSVSSQQLVAINRTLPPPRRFAQRNSSSRLQQLLQTGSASPGALPQSSTKSLREILARDSMEDQQEH